MNKITLVFIVIFVLIYCNLSKSNHGPTISEHLENTNSKDAIDPMKKADTKKIDILDDPLFKDVVFYQNDDDVYLEGKKTGLDKCLDICVGKCVEFGMTSAAFCFPSQ
jgi:hypothetical protein